MILFFVRLRNYETLTLVRLPYSAELIGCIRVQGYASIQITSISPALYRMARASCIIICRAGHISAGLLLTSLMWLTFEPGYWVSCPGLIIYGNISVLVVGAKVA